MVCLEGREISLVIHPSLPCVGICMHFPGDVRIKCFQLSLQLIHSIDGFTPLPLTHMDPPSNSTYKLRHPEFWMERRSCRVNCLLRLLHAANTSRATLRKLLKLHLISNQMCQFVSLSWKRRKGLRAGSWMHFLSNGALIEFHTRIPPPTFDIFVSWWKIPHLWQFFAVICDLLI